MDRPGEGHRGQPNPSNSSEWGRPTTPSELLGEEEKWGDEELQPVMTEVESAKGELRALLAGKLPALEAPLWEDLGTLLAGKTMPTFKPLRAPHTVSWTVNPLGR